MKCRHGDTTLASNFEAAQLVVHHEVPHIGPTEAERLQVGDSERARFVTNEVARLDLLLGFVSED